MDETLIAMDLRNNIGDVSGRNFIYSYSWVDVGMTKCTFQDDQEKCPNWEKGRKNCCTWFRRSEKWCTLPPPKKDD